MAVDEEASADSEAASGYAKEMTTEYQARQEQVLEGLWSKTILSYALL